MTELIPVARACLAPGMIVFRAKEKGASGWALPSRYAGHADQRDYYHVGIVTGTAPLSVLHMSAPGVCRNRKTGKWAYAGQLKYVKEEEKPLNGSVYAYVISPDGNPVKLRRTASVLLPYLEKLPAGTAVRLLEPGPDWCRVRSGTREGYIMTRFLSAERECRAEEGVNA